MKPANAFLLLVLLLVVGTACRSPAPPAPVSHAETRCPALPKVAPRGSPPRLVLQRAHRGGVVGMAAKDGRLLATSSADGGVGIWDVGRGRLLGTFQGEGAVRASLSGRPRRMPAVTRPPRARLEGKPHVAPDGASVRLGIAVSLDTRVDVIRLFAEGRLVDARTVCVADGTVELAAPLLEGQNRLAVVAFDDRGFASAPAVVDVAGHAATGRDGDGRSDLWVVAAGVSRYPNLPAELQLERAADDARAVAARFGEEAGEGKLYRKAHVSTLLDEDVTPESLDRALAGLAGIGGRDVAVVFLAGHGVKDGERGDMRFVTSPATMGPAGRGGVSWEAIASRLARVRGRVVVLLDACHSGHVSQELVVPNDSLAHALRSRAATVVFAAAKGRQFSFEPSGVRALRLVAGAPAARKRDGDHGFFTAALLAALDAPKADANGDGALQFTELVDAVTRDVTERSGGLQTPWVAQREKFGDFRVVAAPTAAPAAEDAP